jgi:tRNA threonylcarbamoyladenosine biosynthesis protein TsaE
MTLQLGALLGERAVGGEVIGLTGPLGAGKSCLVKGIARGLGLSERDICSPTFILAHSHFGRLALHHLDLYRIDSPHQMPDLEDYFDARGVTAIEWAERGCLPEERLTVTLRYRDGDRREIALSGSEGRHAAWLEEVMQAWTKRSPPSRGS